LKENEEVEVVCHFWNGKMRRAKERLMRKTIEDSLCLRAKIQQKGNRMEKFDCFFVNILTLFKRMGFLQVSF
jgi:hypothetical protein